MLRVVAAFSLALVDQAAHPFQPLVDGLIRQTAFQKSAQDFPDREQIVGMHPLR